MGKMYRDLEIKRGMVFYANLSTSSVGSVQTGRRPVVIVQNDIGNKFSPCVIVAVITSQVQKAKLPTHVLLEKEDIEILKLNRASMITTEQTFTIDKKQLDTYLGTLSSNKVEEINKALAISIGLAKPSPRGIDMEVLEDKVEDVKELDSFISMWKSKGRLLKDIRDFLEEREMKLKDLVQYCNDNGVRVERYYNIAEYQRKLVC